MKKTAFFLTSIFVFSFFVSFSQNFKNIRFATFNTSLYRNDLGEIEKDLKSGENEQMKIIAEIIQRNNPDILALQEFDFAEDNKYVKLFLNNYLEKSQNGTDHVSYKFYYASPSNTGILTEFDLNNDGRKDIVLFHLRSLRIPQQGFRCDVGGVGPVELADAAGRC